MFDLQVLLHPLEEGLELPLVVMNFCDGDCRQIEAIACEGKGLVRFGVAKGPTARVGRIGQFRFRCGEQNALFSAQSS